MVYRAAPASLARLEIQAGAVDAIAQAPGFARTVGEDVAEVPFAGRAAHFGAGHAVGGVDDLVIDRKEREGDREYVSYARFLARRGGHVFLGPNEASVGAAVKGKRVLLSAGLLRPKLNQVGLITAPAACASLDAQGISEAATQAPTPQRTNLRRPASNSDGVSPMITFRNRRRDWREPSGNCH